jgi:general secretion pathway protein E
LCDNCRAPEDEASGAAALLGFTACTTLYRPVGCKACNGSGYRGRIGLFEAVAVDSEIRRLILENGDEGAIAAHAFAHSPSLHAAARALVAEGLTTAEEAIRVSRTSDEPIA